jgi:hypothetical protein
MPVSTNGALAANAFTTTASTYSFNYSCPATTTFLVIVEQSQSATPGAPTSMTYNGLPLALIPGSFIGEPVNGNQTSVWYLPNPPTGTLYPLVVNYAQSVTGGGNLLHLPLVGVNQANPFTLSSATYSSSSSSPAISPVAATANDLAFASLVVNDSGGVVVTDTGGNQTNLRNSTSRASICLVLDSAPGDAFASVFSWSLSVAESWAANAIAFLALPVTGFPMESDEYY